MWPLCSSTRATPLKIITTARRSVQTLIGSKEAFSTRTRPFIQRRYYASPLEGVKKRRRKVNDCRRKWPRTGTFGAPVAGFSRLLWERDSVSRHCFGSWESKAPSSLRLADRKQLPLLARLRRHCSLASRAMDGVSLTLLRRTSEICGRWHLIRPRERSSANRFGLLVAHSNFGFPKCHRTENGWRLAQEVNNVTSI